VINLFEKRKVYGGVINGGGGDRGDERVEIEFIDVVGDI
jgi:hypothetical protein